MASTMASTLVLSRPSEKFGTHSTSVDIREEDSWGRSREATGALELRQTRNSRKAVEACIECQDAVDTMLLHDRQMHGVPRAETLVSEDDLFSSLDGGAFNGEDFVDRVEK